MARSDLLINLVKAASSGDQRLLRSTVEAIVAEERGKQHNVLADRLQSAMNGAAGNVLKSLRPAAVDGADRSKEVVVEVNPDRRLGDLLLPEIVRVACGQLVEEQRRADLLRAHSLEPRHRVLLIGPPGNGKTSLAEALADELAVPLFVVRYEGMIGSYLGETAARLKRVFERVPLPIGLDSTTEFRAVTVTLAWFSPINPQHQGYRMAALEAGPGGDREFSVGVERARVGQPNDKAARRGTVFHERREGVKAASFVDNGDLLVRVSCRTPASEYAEPVPYALAVSLEVGVGSQIQVYDLVRTGIEARVRSAIRPR
jgi:ATPase family associated with various cellular activities (AAA)